ncbi:MAG: hypothetical protein JJE30_04220 [Desulfuromonadales bacterium]|nr:hypothetical protein [Desulfuromonadales bacterium]
MRVTVLLIMLMCAGVPALAVDRYHDLLNGKHSHLTAGIFSLTGSYRLQPHWAIRTTWNRIITNYNMDTDVILGGIGYRF